MLAPSTFTTRATLASISLTSGKKGTLIIKGLLRNLGLLYIGHCNIATVRLGCGDFRVQGFGYGLALKQTALTVASIRIRNPGVEKVTDEAER